MHLVQANTNNVHLPHGKFDSPNQKPYPDLGSDMSSVWNFCAHFSDVISQGNRGGFAKCQLFSQAVTKLDDYFWISTYVKNNLPF